MDMSKIIVLNDADLDAVTGAWGYVKNSYNYVNSSGGFAVSGVATGNNTASTAPVNNQWTGYASANGGNVSIG